MDLFAPVTATVAPLVDARAQQLMQRLDALNHRFGRGTVRAAATVPAVGQPAP